VQLTRPQPTVLELRWPTIDNAVQYRVTLYRSAAQEHETIAEQITTTPHASFSNFAFTPNRRYEWELSGSTRDGATFRASGGFVAPESQHPAGAS
jgi:hypothetical protein